MYRNINILLILLHSAVFCADDTTVETFTGSTEQMSTESPFSSTDLLSSSTSTDESTTYIQPSSPVTEEPHRLTSGQIAGVVLGSITGAAALGGGIYAGLKYTGKLPA